MPARIRTVQNTLTLPGATQPLPKRLVMIRLNTVGFINSGAVEKVQQRYVETDATGTWSADLEVNADITPAGSYYTVQELNTISWTFVVPVGSGPVQLFDCLTVTPQAGPLPVVSVGYNIDGGYAGSIYTTEQVIDGGAAA